MKLMYLSIIIFLFSCSTKMVYTTSDKVTNELQINIILDDETNMKLSMKNNSGEEFRFGDPKCYVNSTIEIFGNKGKVQQALKIKPDTNCATNMITLEAGEEKQFSYPYRLSELFQLERDTEYEILLSYTGGIVSSNGKVFDDGVNSKQKFIIH